MQQHAMHIKTDFGPKDVPTALSWLGSQFGSALKKRVEDLEARAQRNPLFSFYAHQHFGLEFALEQARRHHRKTNRYPKGEPFDLSYGFAVTAQRLYENLDAEARVRFSGSMRDALRGQYGLRPVAYELQILTHLCRRGFDVVCMDLSGTANFDFLATRSGAELEVECKTTAPDAGLKVHLDEVTRLGGYLLPISRRLFEAGGHHLIQIQLPDRLLAHDTIMKNLTALVETAVLTGIAVMQDVAIVEYRRPAAPTQMPVSDIEEQARSMFRSEFHKDVGTILFHGNTSGGGFVAIAVQSLKQDSVIETVSQRAKEAAKQCSGARPAVIAMQLLEMSPQTLRDAVYGPSRLYDIANAVFGNDNRGHVNSIVFTLPPKLQGTALANIAEATGPVGIIPNPTPTFPSALASELFTPSGRATQSFITMPRQAWRSSTT
jgi:Holliday junction resolvase